MKRVLVITMCASAWLSGTAVAQEVFVDFRNRIPGLVDAPVFDADGITALRGEQYWIKAQLYYSVFGPQGLWPVGYPGLFLTGSDAGYWEPQLAPLPGATLGQRIWVQALVYERWGSDYGDYYFGLRGVSETFEIVVTNTVVQLLDLKSFSLQPETLSARFMGGELHISWRNAGARYELQAAEGLSPPVSWEVVQAGFSAGIGQYITVTNSVDSAYRFYRLQRWREQ